MRNIVVVGLTKDGNLGDPLIYQCTLHLLHKSFSAHGNPYEIRELDLYGRTASKTNIIDRTFAKIDAMINGVGWENSAIFWLKRDLRRKIDGTTKAIIFCGGGLIKFNHQFLSEPIKLVIKYAQRKKIPVMMSAVGVEGYDDSNQDCLSLKKVINLPCVKHITTRDDLYLLNSRWIESNIKTSLVFDPACYANEVYVAKPHTDVVGLGICREGLFADYGVDISADELLLLWKQLYVKLTEKGFNPCFFTNGLSLDQRFAERVVKELHLDKTKVLIDVAETPEKLCGKISSMRGIIATRLHSTIVAYSYHVPFVGLVWNKKQTMFGHCVGKEQFFVEKENFNAAYIVSQLMKSIEENHSEAIPESDSTYQQIDSFLCEFVYGSEREQKTLSIYQRSPER